MLRLLVLLVATLALSSAASVTCPDVQERLDRVEAYPHPIPGSSWADATKLFGQPHTISQSEPYTVLAYNFGTCGVVLHVREDGQVARKKFTFGPSFPVQPRATLASSANGNTALIVEQLARLEALVARLETRLATLEKTGSVTHGTRASLPRAGSSVPFPSATPEPSFLAPPQVFGLSAVPPVAKRSTEIAAPTGCTESGSCFGDISGVTGNPKTVYVDGYYRKNGTYVRPHYRSAPRSR